ncbi:MAG TPA: trehalose-phosphatase, partial [Dehalococcoidales bacterium]|nr:trehalose-phosphatase [Dehalococcoidales bacterium]
YLFDVWPEFASAFQKAPHVLLLTDYDGTLTEIVGRPQDALLPETVRQKLRALSQKEKVSVGVITGRQMAELKSLVQLDGIYYAGQHGLEIDGPGLEFIHPQAQKAKVIIAQIVKQLVQSFHDLDGIIIQAKGFSVSVHYRMVKPRDESLVAEKVHAITAPFVNSGAVKVYPMKKVWEIRPPIDWDKGRAALYIGDKIKKDLDLSALLTIYLGDDTTDEDAFRVVRRPEGWGVFICGEKTESSAEYFLRSVSEVEELLDRIGTLKKAPG